MSTKTAEPISVYPFHQPFPGMPDLFHVACTEHPGFGYCGERDQADVVAADHAATHQASPRRADR